MIRCRIAGELVCEVPGRALADDAPRYAIAGRAPAASAPDGLAELAAEPPSVDDAARAARHRQRARPQADLAPLRPHERHEHAGRPGSRRRRAAAHQGHPPRAGAGDRRPGPARVGALDPVPGRRVGRGRGRAQRRLLGRDADRDHRLPELRVTRDRARCVAARARRSTASPTPAAHWASRSCRAT